MRYLWEAFTAGPPLGQGRLPVNLFFLPIAFALGFVHPVFWLAGVALEGLFLGILLAMPRFRRAVDAKWSAKNKSPQPTDAKKKRRDLLRKLHPDLRIRFGKLQKKVTEIHRILADDHIEDYLQEGNLTALDRLEWTHLKLLMALENLGSGPSLADAERELKQETNDEQRTLKRLQWERAQRRSEVDDDLTRVESQVSVALENARLQRHDGEVLPDITLTTQLGDPALFGDAAASVRQLDSLYEPSATTTAATPLTERND